jgi:hypothetical protein
LNATQVVVSFKTIQKKCPNQKLEIIISEYVDIDLKVKKVVGCQFAAKMVSLIIFQVERKESSFGLS